MSIAFTWWGHASTTVELGGVRVALDPLLVDRLFHLRRYAASPAAGAFDADVVLISHLHSDHFHVPSLRRFGRGTTLVVPRGGEGLVRDLDVRRVVPVAPGETLDLDGLVVDVLGATHDGHRLPRSRLVAPALGFRVAAGGSSFWFPGDTELREDMATVAPVDLALAPVGGWGPTLADGHMDPVAAATAVARVGATWAVPVHWGTFWPIGLARLDRATHTRLFQTPGARFAEALADADAVLGAHGERVEL